MPTLLYKWLKSENTSSKGSRKIAKLTIKRLGITPRQYRLMLATGRDYLKVVETRMSAKEWHNIDYSQVPSVAMNRYRKAFHNQDGERFREFLGKVEKGEESINAGTLYPYDIVEKLLNSRHDDDTLNVQWDALPNYLGDTNANIVVMADVSGSMTGRPMATSVGLALYFAERNQGAYHNLFMTFSNSPQFVSVMGNTLYEKLAHIEEQEWNMNTNLKKAMMRILEVARQNRVAPQDMPKALLIISDMEIDHATDDRNFLRAMAEEYELAGYQLPGIVFWNVDSRQDTFLTDGNHDNVMLVSGQSPSVFRNVMEMLVDDYNPYRVMCSILFQERYDKIDFTYA